MRPGHTVLDGEVIDIGGPRVGFVGGGLRTPMRTPYELDEETTPPRSRPSVGSTCCARTSRRPCRNSDYDVVARRFEYGSTAMLDLVRRTQPRLVLFGHVHQPLVARARIGRTECVNVGHFRGSGRPFAVSW